jgi:hypothetical protein
VVKAKLWYGAEKHDHRERRLRALEMLFAPLTAQAALLSDADA